MSDVFSEEVEVDETTVGWGKSKQIKKMKFGPKSGGVKPGKLSDLEKHNKDLRAKKEETEIDERSKKTMGSYVKKASVDKSNAGITLGQTSASGKQTQADVQKHAGKMIKRQKGIDKAVDKLSKEEVDMSMVDAVKEVLGHAGWAGLGNMPPTDPKTGKYVTGKTKIKRLPYDKNNPSKKPEKK